MGERIQFTCICDPHRPSLSFVTLGGQTCLGSTMETSLGWHHGFYRMSRFLLDSALKGHKR